MRKLVYGLLTMLLVALVGCVTINVYFPEAAAQKAADQFIGTVLDNAPAPAPKGDETAPPAKKGSQPSAMLLDLLIPAAYAADTPNLRIQTATTDAIHGRMQARFRDTLAPLFNSGVVGFTQDGLVAVRDAGKVPLDQRSAVNAAVADENRDRNALYREVANANNHPDWEGQIRTTFAKGWIERARAGWYYQDTSGAWKQK
ncbi:YdbL family protein [Dyella telluris]|uniref:YdbL family protein n=1 Tax=Dyella telluris TaxID=2763498 RepID=A0A7G8Q465_9GAMM|nr:YdbL family protein [Dyella telluris]QNK01573.1 YdbL family protein [Dyella telluris]